MSKKNKQKKPKVKYVDDGRSLADMSGLNGKKPTLGNPRGSLADQSKTFFGAMRMMIKPMLCAMGIITLAFLIMWILLMLSIR